MVRGRRPVILVLLGIALLVIPSVVVLAWLALTEPVWMSGDVGEGPVLVQGDTYRDVRGEVFAVAPPYFVAVYRGDPSDPDAGTDAVVEGNTDENGDFLLRADVSEDDARNLYVYVVADWAEGCGYVELPPLSREDDAWVDAQTGQRVTVRVTLREPPRSGIPCA